MKYEIPYEQSRISHPDLGYEIDIFVPSKASHRPAVEQALSGQYYEEFSHINFKKILDYKGNKAVIHAGTFFGDMLHTYSNSASRVYAFEPVLENYVLAKLNAAQLNLPNVYLFNSALSDANSLAAIQVQDSDGAFLGGASTVTEAAHEQTEMIVTSKVDSLPVKDICLIQLDVEGHEKRALQGALVTITKYKPIILIEDNDRDCKDFLNGLGYSMAFDNGGLSYWATSEDLEFVRSLNI